MFWMAFRITLLYSTSTPCPLLHSSSTPRIFYSICPLLHVSSTPHVFVNLSSSNDISLINSFTFPNTIHFIDDSFHSFSLIWSILILSCDKTSLYHFFIPFISFVIFAGSQAAFKQLVALSFMSASAMMKLPKSSVMLLLASGQFVFDIFSAGLSSPAGMISSGTARYNIIQYSTVQYSTLRYSALQYSTV